MARNVGKDGVHGSDTQLSMAWNRHAVTSALKDGRQPHVTASLPNDLITEMAP